jgi:hypothetical protein
MTSVAGVSAVTSILNFCLLRPDIMGLSSLPHWGLWAAHFALKKGFLLNPPSICADDFRKQMS